jgi:hypothetical protein
MAIARPSFYAVDLVTGDVVDELPLTSVTYSDVVSARGGFTATLPIRRPRFPVRRADLEPGSTGLAVALADRLLFAGIIWTLTAELENPEAEVGGEGYLSAYADGRRTIRSRVGMTQTASSPAGGARWPGTRDVFVIIEDLFRHAATFPGDLGLPIVKRGPGTGGNLGATLGEELIALFADRPGIYEHLEQLTATEPGFDFGYGYRWEDDGAGNMRPVVELELARVRGRRTGLVFEAGKNIAVLEWSVDASELANALDGTGAGEADAMVTASEVDPNVIAPNGRQLRLEATLTRKDLTSRALLRAWLRAELTIRKRPTEVIRVEVTNYEDAPLGSYIAGDLARFEVNDGLIETSGWWRIVGIDVTLDADGRQLATIDATPESAYGDLFGPG